MASSSITQQPQPQPQPFYSIPIDIIESSIEVLLKNRLRRIRWQHLFSHRQEEDHGRHRAPWRIYMVNFLESTFVRALALLLLLVDLIFTILDLSSSLLSCMHPTGKRVENKVFHWGGIAILSLFSAKILALAMALGCGSFIRRPGLVVDGVVVVVALLLESFVEMKGAGLIVLVSLWRVVRVVESAFELSDEAIEVQIQMIACQFEALRAENRCLQVTIAEKDQWIMELEEAMNQCGVHTC